MFYSKNKVQPGYASYMPGIALCRFSGQNLPQIAACLLQKAFFKHTLAFAINIFYSQLLNFHSRQSVCPMLSS